ncbi:MAG: hypothetical protein WB988_24900 [Candidatus Nitrosopolaris sp.]
MTIAVQTGRSNQSGKSKDKTGEGISIEGCQIMKTARAGEIRICRICRTTPTLANRNYDLCHKCYASYLEAREKKRGDTCSNNDVDV